MKKYNPGKPTHLIKIRPMPNDCIKCPLRQIWDGKELCNAFEGFVYNNAGHGRPTYCPLKPLKLW